MQTAIGAISFAAQAVGASTTEIRAGWIISGLVAAFMAFDAAGKFAKPKQVTEAFEGIGWPIQLSSTLGAILLACAALYLIPQTSLFGAILLIGYLGGAVATNLRLHNPLSDAHAFSRVFRRAWLHWVVASGAQTPIGVPIVEVGVLG